MLAMLRCKASWKSSAKIVPHSRSNRLGPTTSIRSESSKYCRGLSCEVIRLAKDRVTEI